MGLLSLLQLQGQPCSLTGPYYLSAPSPWPQPTLNLTSITLETKEPTPALAMAPPPKYTNLLQHTTNLLPPCSILQTISIPCSSASSSFHSKKLLPRTCSKTCCLPCPPTQTLCSPSPAPTILPPTTTPRPTTTSWSRY